MRRAVITGLGIVSCLGNDRESVTKSLREGISGIRRRGCGSRQLHFEEGGSWRIE